MRTDTGQGRSACWCGNPATRECDYCGSQFVCGAPICDKHECNLTGLHGSHSKVGRTQFDDWREEQADDS